MTATVSPFELLAAAEKVERMKPRECISVWMLGPQHSMELAKLRVYHPGGVPNFDPQTWTGAFENGRLVAAIGWSVFEKGIATILEVDKVRDRWGIVGTVVLIQSFIKGAYDKGMRVQAWVMPTNEKLKAYIRRTLPGARPILEVWEQVPD